MSPRPHRALVDLALALATLAMILGAGARWIDTELLNASQWTRTSGQLIANRTVRDAVSRFAVSRAFGRAGIDSAIDRVLPGAAATDAQRVLHRAAGGAAGSVLSSRGGRRAWENANRQAVSGLLAAVNHPARHAGVSLQLTPLLSDIVHGVASVPIVHAIPGSAAVLTLHGADAGRLQMFSAAQVHDIAPGVRAVRTSSWALPLAALALLGLAVVLAQGWRARALRRVGYAVLIAGGAVLGLRALAQYGLADLKVSSSADRAAVRAAWLTATVDLRTEALFLVVAGAVIALGAWLMRLVRR